MFEDIKGVIIIRLTKDRLYNGQTKREQKYNDHQNNTQKTNDCATQFITNPAQNGGDFW